MHLLGRGGLVDRDGKRAGGQDREIEQCPLEAGGAQDRNPVTGLHPLGNQTLCGRANQCCGLARG